MGVVLFLWRYATEFKESIVFSVYSFLDKRDILFSEMAEAALQFEVLSHRFGLLNLPRQPILAVYHLVERKDLGLHHQATSLDRILHSAPPSGRTG